MLQTFTYFQSPLVYRDKLAYGKELTELKNLYTKDSFPADVRNMKRPNGKVMCAEYINDKLVHGKETYHRIFGFWMREKGPCRYNTLSSLYYPMITKLIQWDVDDSDQGYKDSSKKVLWIHSQHDKINEKLDEIKTIMVKINEKEYGDIYYY